MIPFFFWGGVKPFVFNLFRLASGLIFFPRYFEGPSKTVCLEGKSGTSLVNVFGSFVGIFFPYGELLVVMWHKWVKPI